MRSQPMLLWLYPENWLFGYRHYKLDCRYPWSDSRHIHRYRPVSHAVGWFVFVVYVIILILSALLLQGIRHERRGFVMAWVWGMVVCVILQIIGAILDIVAGVWGTGIADCHTFHGLIKNAWKILENSGSIWNIFEGPGMILEASGTFWKLLEKSWKLLEHSGSF
ncbi:hypothetical protein Pmani_039128 [Petrolisthes manimaculis]|uniref:Uncharacterized protein n=1 Tax=Petrolisthes manimaculis TaxID=1843537 RepID=A0AAE1TJK7_9EUCA|nr:hypothetical protein Pmani_039128 [Petrolisthes manimaculis]